MANVSSMIGFADFSSPLPLEEVAKRLSEDLFAGIQFTCQGSGGWDEIPCLQLDRDFLGLRVELGGDPNGGYTLELSMILSALPTSHEPSELREVADISAILKNQLARIPILSLTPPNY